MAVHLLNADPMNGDAAEALARMKTKAAAQPTRPSKAYRRRPTRWSRAASGETTIPLDAPAPPPSDLEKFDGVQSTRTTTSPGRRPGAGQEKSS